MLVFWVNSFDMKFCNSATDQEKRHIWASRKWVRGDSVLNIRDNSFEALKKPAWGVSFGSSHLTPDANTHKHRLWLVSEQRCAASRQVQTSARDNQTPITVPVGRRVHRTTSAISRSITLGIYRSAHHQRIRYTLDRLAVTSDSCINISKASR